MSFVRAAQPIWLFRDLTGLPLDDTYWIFFEQNVLPYNFQTVYQTPFGTPWANPMQFQPNGELPDNLYFDPTLVYRIEIRSGNTTAAALIGNPIENFIPGGSNSISTDIFSDASNLITNPQFADIDFISPVTYAAAGTYDIAPGWNLILVGTGSTTVTQNFISGQSSSAASIPGNPPSDLTFANNGWTSVTLQQALPNNGAIFANGSIAFYMLASAATSQQTITFNYVPSGGSPTTHSFAVSAGALASYSAVMNVGASTNSNTGAAAFVDINITLPATGTVTLTNLQLLGQSEAVPSPGTQIAPIFQETSYPQQVNQEFYLYKNPLIYKPIPSWLTGWDFPLNPAQFGSSLGVQAIGAGKSYYVWDQTIVFQSVDSCASFSRGSAGEFVITAAATGQVAVIQYLEAAQARKILNSPMAVNISSATSISNGLGGIVSLYYTKDSSLPSAATGTNNSIVLTIDTNGKPLTFNGNWFEIPRLTSQAPEAAPNATHGQDAIFTSPNNSTDAFSDVSFSGWDMNGSTDANAATFFAIVIGFKSFVSTNTINLNSVGLMSGSFATRPAPQTPDEVLRECQRYLEYSYDVPALTGATSSPIGTGSTSGEVSWVAPSSIVDNASMDRPFKVTKRVSPTVTWYSPFTPFAQSTVYDVTNSAPRPVTSQVGIGKGSTGYIIASGNFAINSINVGQWTAEARLGII